MAGDRRDGPAAWLPARKYRAEAIRDPLGRDPVHERAFSRVLQRGGWRRWLSSDRPCSNEEEAWDAAHEWVQRIRSGMSGRVHAHDASVYELLPPPSGLTLDVGCGEGRLTRELGARGYDVIGVDASEVLVAEARSADPDGRYEVASIDAIPFSDGAAALAVCVNVVPHVHDLDAAARELARVLAPGGELLIGTIRPIAQAGTCDKAASFVSLGYSDRASRRSYRSGSTPSAPAPNDRGSAADVPRRRVLAGRPPRGARPERLDAALSRPAARALLTVEDERRLPAVEGERVREPVERHAQADRAPRARRESLPRTVERLEPASQSWRCALTLPKTTRFSSTASTPITCPSSSPSRRGRRSRAGTRRRFARAARGVRHQLRVARGLDDQVELGRAPRVGGLRRDVARADASAIGLAGSSDAVQTSTPRAATASSRASRSRRRR